VASRLHGRASVRWIVGVLLMSTAAACSTGGPREARLPPETVGWVLTSRGLLVARMEEAISTSEARAGQTFHATLAAPFQDSRGNVRIAPGAKLIGRVTEIRRGHGARPPAIELRFEELVAGRERYRLDAPVTAADIQQGAPELDRTSIRGGVLGGVVVGVATGFAYGGASVLLATGVGSLGGLVSSAGQRVVDAKVPARSFVTAHVHAIAREE
jgi:hypothetical protein